LNRQDEPTKFPSLGLNAAIKVTDRAQKAQMAAMLVVLVLSGEFARHFQLDGENSVSDFFDDFPALVKFEASEFFDLFFPPVIEFSFTLSLLSAPN